MIISPHSPGSQDPHKRARGIPAKRFMVGTAVMITLSYLTVVLACACIDGKHLGSSAVQNLARVSTTSETPGRDTDEELCKFVHERMLTLQASSSGPILVAKASYLDVLIGEASRQTAILNAFRPPGNSFALARTVSFQLYSVLRI